jgi:hypothetical protein
MNKEKLAELSDRLMAVTPYERAVSYAERLSLAREALKGARLWLYYGAPPDDVTMRRVTMLLHLCEIVDGELGCLMREQKDDE